MHAAGVPKVGGERADSGLLDAGRIKRSNACTVILDVEQSPAQAL